MLVKVKLGVFVAGTGLLVFVLVGVWVRVSVEVGVLVGGTGCWWRCSCSKACWSWSR